MYIIIITVGIKYDTIQKDLGSNTEREGLHSGPPGFEFIIFPSVYKSMEYESLKVRVIYSPQLVKTNVDYCKRSYFRWGEISQKFLQDISSGGNFQDTTPISFLKAYGF